MSPWRGAAAAESARHERAGESATAQHVEGRREISPDDVVGGSRRAEAIGGLAVRRRRDSVVMEVSMSVVMTSNVRTVAARGRVQDRDLPGLEFGLGLDDEER